MVQDMTTGNPLKLILKFAFPLLIGNVFQQLYQISDMIIVGRLLGVNALAAVGASAPIYFVILMVVFGFTSGLTVITAQRFGAKDEKGVRNSVVHCVVAALSLSAAVSIFCLCFLEQILNVMNVPQEIMEDAYNFIFYLLSGMVLIVGYNLLSGIIRALGDSRTPLYFLILSSVLNIIFNYILIKYVGLGIIGSAVGTLFAISLSVIACIWYIGRRFEILRLRKEDWKLNKGFMMEHLDVAFPMSFQFSIIAVSLMIIQSVCNTFGPNAIAAFAAALRIEQLATQPLLALGLAIATYSAQNFGAGMMGRIRKGVANASLTSLSISIVMALLVRFVGENMVDIFIKEPNEEIIHTAQVYLNISTLFYFFLGQIFIFRNCLQGMGQTKIPVLASAVELLMRSFAAVYLANHIGFLGVCWAGPIAWIGASLVVSVGYWRLLCQFVKVRRFCWA